MPTYVWECEEHGKFESIFRMKDKPTKAPCPECSNPSYQVPVYGGIQSDEPAWLYKDDTLGALQSPNEKPIENRTEWKRYMREKDIVMRD